MHDEKTEALRTQLKKALDLMPVLDEGTYTLVAQRTWIEGGATYIETITTTLKSNEHGTNGIADSFMTTSRTDADGTRTFNYRSLPDGHVTTK